MSWKRRLQWRGCGDESAAPGYAGAITTFAGYCGALAAARLTGRRAPAQLSPLALVLEAAADFLQLAYASLDAEKE